MQSLTNDREVDCDCEQRFGADLAVVQSGVVISGSTDGQRPDGAARAVFSLEPQVGGVRIPADRENVQVRLSNPRDLPARTGVGRVKWGFPGVARSYRMRYVSRLRTEAYFRGDCSR